nr:hypothetical protein [Streptomyces sp. SID5468]
MVRAAGDAAHDVAQAVHEDAKSVHGPTDSAVDGLAGWQSARALRDCGDAWSAALRSLSDLVAATGDALADAACAYHQEDQRRGHDFAGLTVDGR